MILSRKYGIVLIMAIIIFIPNVGAIKMSVSGNGVSYSGDYHMAASASLQDNILLSGEGIFQDTKASGKGKNAIIQSIAGYCPSKWRRYPCGSLLSKIFHFRCLRSF